MLFRPPSLPPSLDEAFQKEPRIERAVVDQPPTFHLHLGDASFLGAEIDNATVAAMDTDTDTAAADTDTTVAATDAAAAAAVVSMVPFLGQALISAAELRVEVDARL
jgi:hypothetical protein